MNWGPTRVCYQAIYTIALVLSPVGALFSKKLRIGLKQRIGLKHRLGIHAIKFQGNPYWIHFASSGEFEQALPIAEEIKKRNPQQKILFSYFSPSGARGLFLEQERRQKAGIPLPWDYADYCPFDVYPLVREALDLIQPKALILINREIWPELILQCTTKRIPCYLFVSYLPKYKVTALKFWRRYLNSFTKIGVVGDSTATLLKAQSIQTPIEILGDTRIERVLKRKAMPKQKPPYSSFLETKPIFLMASIWPEDFQNLKPALEWIRDTAQDWRMIFVPHEPEDIFIDTLKTWAKPRNLLLRRFTHFLQTPDDDSHLIIDKVGGLAELYQFSKIAFVGGSFKKRIHNVLEPAAYGNAIVTGPLMENSHEASEMDQLGLGLKRCGDAATLKAYLKELVTDPSLLRDQGAKAYQYLLDRTGAAKKYVDSLE